MVDPGALLSLPRPTFRGVVFALLIVATVGAFFITQRLKSAPPPVERVYYPAWISPNGDGRKDVVTMRFRLPRDEAGTVQVVDDAERPVRTLAAEGPLGAGRHAFPWDGRTDGGALAPPGGYRLRVILSSAGRTLTALPVLTLDLVPPRPRIVAVTPRNLIPGGSPQRSRARIRFVGPSDPAPVFGVLRLGRGRPREVGRFVARRFRETATWDGRVRGRPARPADYAFRLTVQDRAGNAGTVAAPEEVVTVRRAPGARRGR